jgi:antirestriction protein
MSITLTTNYREVLAPETVEKIDGYLESLYDLGAILEFIDEHSEEDFREYYEEYVEAGEEHGFEAVDFFINEVADLSDLDKFERAYIGEYSSPARMAEDFLEDEVDRLHYMIVVDWEATAEYLIDHDVDRYGDHYFRCCF